jgi:hypothetical protein
VLASTVFDIEARELLRESRRAYDEKSMRSGQKYKTCCGA